MARPEFRPRLLPVVIGASVGLLALKVIGLTTQGGYIIAPDPARVSFGRGLTDVRQIPDWAQQDVTGATPAKKPAAEPPPEKKAEGAPQPLPPAPPSAAERELYENLGARRRQLDERAKELEMREQLLKSAEKLTQERLDELKKAEATPETQEKSAGNYKALVTMYETMKPRDAAKVFDKMDAQRLAPLVRQMNPKKLAEILAAMSPEAAEKLTFVLMPQIARPQPTPVEKTQPEELERLPLPTPTG